MKIILLNAPGGSHYEGPMMGVPALKGQLEEEGFGDVVQRDLDLELFYHCLEPSVLKKIRGSIRRADILRSSSLGLVKKLILALIGPLYLRWLAGSALREKAFIERFRNDTPIDRQFPESGLLRYKKALNRILKMMAIYFYPHLAYPRFFSLSEKKGFHRYHLAFGNGLAKSCRHGDDALMRFYEEKVVPGLDRCDVIGISVSFKRQLEPGMLLAKVLRKHMTGAKIVLGGSFVTNTLDSGFDDTSLFDNADYVITYEGEEAFIALLRSLESGQNLDEVPNLVHRKEGELIRNKRASIFDMDSLAAPDYGGLDLANYLDRPVRLPLMTSRGCYWGKCAYCSHHWTLGSGRLRVRSPEKLIDDITAFKARYGANSIYFTDESVHPPTIETFAKLVIDRGLDIRWVGTLRFDDCVDRDFLKLLRESGCHALLFGLESLSEYVQQIIRKGIRLDRAHEIMEHCRELGIHVHLFIILGVPGERDEDIRANYRYLLENTHLYETVQLATFELMVGSPMYRHPDRYGIKHVQTHSVPGREAYTEVTFETEHGLDRRQVERHARKFFENKVLFEKDLWEGFGYRLYRDVGG